MIEDILTEAKQACRSFQLVDTQTKIQALDAIEQALRNEKQRILLANQKDLDAARKNGMRPAMLDRLMLNEERIDQMADGVAMVAQLDDPIGQEIRTIHRPNGLDIHQVRIPIGTVGVVYEARPNVTVDIAAICLKTNNVCILKGGKEAFYSNQVLSKVGIPRGGKGLISHVVENAKVPVIETGAGLCHLYVDKDANLDMAVEIAVNAKTQRPSVCNAIETILVHKDIAEAFLTQLKPRFKAVKIYGDERSLKVLDGQLATKENYGTEYDDMICNVKVVADIDEAIEHIYTYSTKHSECIVTENKENASYFMDALDSACVYQNASTRFTDGGQFGFGAEVPKSYMPEDPLVYKK